MGTKVKFLVWPALFLHEGGALISKGVLQPIPYTNTRFSTALEHTYQSRNNVKTTNEFVLIYNILN
jgi:hypothetical protein